MKNNITSLSIPNKLKLRELLERTLADLQDDQGDIIVNQAVLIMDTEGGVGYFNMVRTNIFSLIGLVEVAKVYFTDELSALSHDD